MKKRGQEDVFRTMMVIATGFLVIYLVWRGDWALYTSLAVGLAGSLSGWLSHKVVFVWHKTGWLMGLIVPNILLTIVFYLVLFPLALLSRLTGKRSLVSLRNRRGSMFVECRKEYPPASFGKPW
jgi:hypothetical protein